MMVIKINIVPPVQNTASIFSLFLRTPAYRIYHNRFIHHNPLGLKCFSKFLKLPVTTDVLIANVMYMYVLIRTRKVSDSIHA